MTKLSNTLTRLRPNSGRHSDRSRELGASLVEYALLVALVAVVCIVAVSYFGAETGDTFSRVGNSVEVS